MTDNHVMARYWIETAVDVDAAAEVMSGEQSSGTFLAVPGETEALKARHRAQVVEVKVTGETDQPSLPGAAQGGRYTQAEVTVAYPVANFGANLPTLVTTLMGNLYELKQFSGLKLLNFELPPSLRGQFDMPKAGIMGTRQRCGVADGPIIGTIIKPSVGLSPQQTAALVEDLAAADIDFIKDDELQANGPHCPLPDRVAAVMAVIHRHAERIGRQIMFAFNISDEVDAMLGHAQTVAEHGGTCVMVSLHSVGFAGIQRLRRETDLPIHGHRNGWGMFSRCPALGVEYAAWQKLWRLAGVDHLHVNGLANKFCEPDDSVVRSIAACLTPIFDDADRAMPVVSSGQWGGQAPQTYQRTGTTDLMYLAGGGIMAHPDGPGAGVRALRQCWEAAVHGVDLREYATDHPELAASLAKFGRS